MKTVVDLNTFDIFEHNSYYKIYEDLINRNVDQEKSSLTYVHHVIPRSYFKLKHLPIDNSINNIVNLSAVDHLKAHYLLCFCVKDPMLLEKMNFAFFQMSRELASNFDPDNFPQYEDIYKRERENRRHRALLQPHRKHSEETKLIIAAKQKGKYVGEIWIHGGKINRHINPDNLQSFLDDGFEIGRNDPDTFLKISQTQKRNPNRSMLGRKQSTYQKETVSKKLRGVKKSTVARENMKVARIGKMLISNDKTRESFYINKNELESYQVLGFHRGRLTK